VPAADGRPDTGDLGHRLDDGLVITARFEALIGRRRPQHLARDVEWMREQGGRAPPHRTTGSP